MKAFNYLSAPIENVRDCFQKPLKGSIHNRAARISSARAGKQQQSIHLPLKKPKRYKFWPEINLPLSAFVFCHIPSPTSHPISCLFIYFVSEGHGNSQRKQLLVLSQGAEFISKGNACSVQAEQKLPELVPCGPPNRRGVLSWGPGRMWDTALSPSTGPPSLGSQNTDKEREAQREHTAVKLQNQELGQVCAPRSRVSLTLSLGFPRGPPHSLSLEQTPWRA